MGKSIVCRWNQVSSYRGSRALRLQMFQNVSSKVYDVLRECFYSPYVTWVPFTFLYQCLTYADCHVRLPVLISFLSLERESSTSVSSAYVFTLYVLSHLIRRFNRQKVYAFQKKLSTRRAIRDIRGVHTVVPVRTTIRLLVLQYELEKRRTFVGRSV